MLEELADPVDDLPEPAPTLVLLQRTSMCHVWTRHTPSDLCERGLWARLKLLREISLFSRDCDSEADNVQLGQFFRLDWRRLQSARDLGPHSEHLLDGVEGRSCVLGAANSDECLRCFRRVGEGLAQLDRAYQAFSKVLRRFDCELALDPGSATRPFSPNGTCADCKVGASACSALGTQLEPVLLPVDAEAFHPNSSYILMLFLNGLRHLDVTFCSLALSMTFPDDDLTAEPVAEVVPEVGAGAAGHGVEEAALHQLVLLRAAGLSAPGHQPRGRLRRAPGLPLSR